MLAGALARAHDRLPLSHQRAIWYRRLFLPRHDARACGTPPTFLAFFGGGVLSLPRRPGTPPLADAGTRRTARHRRRRVASGVAVGAHRPLHRSRAWPAPDRPRVSSRSFSACSPGSRPSCSGCIPSRGTRLSHLDRALLFGHDPWAVLQPVLGHPLVTRAIDFAYVPVLLVVLISLVVWQGWTADRRLREQFLLTFVLAWIALGTVLATMLSSAGPCYYGWSSAHRIPTPRCSITSRACIGSPR